MNVLNAYRKLRRMSAAELRGRVEQHARQRAERRTYRHGQGSSPDRTHDTLAPRLVQRARRLVPGGQAVQIAELKSEFSSFFDILRQKSIDAADRVMSGELKLLATTLRLPDGTLPDWHRDPRSEYRWQRRFYADLPIYELSEGVDVKYVWELGRHQFLVELARGWRVSGDPQYASRVRHLLLDWIGQNPALEGVHWTSALEVAMRSISWLWTIALLDGWQGWEASDLSTIAAALVEHAEYLARHFSLYSSPYNHLIGEASALYLLALWCEGYPAAASWRTQARDTLMEHGPRQFFDDGFCVEQATGYHFFTWGFLAHAIISGQHLDDSWQTLEATMRRALRAGAAMRQPDDRWPAIGDVDSARALPIPVDDYWNFGSLCGLGGIVFDVPDAVAEEEPPGEELYWLLGMDGLRRWTRRATSPPPRCTVLPAAGYAVASSDDPRQGHWMLIDGGPLAAGVHSDSTPSVAHGHADALQILLMRGGRPWLTDSGMPFYGGDRAWVDFARSAAAHNTLEVDGAPWARIVGRLAWAHVHRAPTLEANLTENAWIVRVQGTPVAGVTIDRNVLALREGGVWIADHVRCRSSQFANWYWQFPGNLKPRQAATTPGYHEFCCDQGVLATWSSLQATDVTIDSASARDPVAWQSPLYGVHQAGYRVHLRAGPTREILRVTYFGDAPVAANVAIDGQPLECRAGDLPCDNPPPFAPPAAIHWNVRTSSGWLCVAAGIRETSVAAPWQSLDGEGGWPCAWLDASVVPAATWPRC